MAASLSIGKLEACAIDAHLERSHIESLETVRPLYPEVPRGCDEISSVLAGIDPCLNDEVLYQRLEARASLGDFMMAVGSTTATSSSYIVDDEIIVESVGDDDSDDEMEDVEDVSETEEDADSDSEEQDDNKPEEMEDDSWIHDIFEQATRGDIDFDDIMASATHAR
jgi:hypothetical protein